MKTNQQFQKMISDLHYAGEILVYLSAQDPSLLNLVGGIGMAIEHLQVEQRQMQEEKFPMAKRLN